MAPLAKQFPLIILFLALLSFSFLAHARDSQFFSKVTNNNNNVQEVKVETPNTNEESLKQQKQEKEQNFVQDSKNGYGLWGHESGQNPPTTVSAPNSATTNIPNYNSVAYVTEPQGYTTSTTTTTNNNNNNAYVADPQGLSDTRFAEKEYTATNNNNNEYKPDDVADPQGLSDATFTEKEYNANNYNNEAFNNNNNQYYGNGVYGASPLGKANTRFAEKRYTFNNNNNEAYVTNPQSNGNNYYNGGNNYNGQQQGMSDTRFLENGKYHYDLAKENNYPSGYNYNSDNNNYENGVKRYNTQLSDSSLVDNKYNTQQQGMSDTRFLENGKYHYDLKSENNYGHGFGNSRAVNYNQGYNGNLYENSNYMGEYQNQEEFEENQEEEYVP